MGNESLFSSKITLYDNWSLNFQSPTWTLFYNDPQIIELLMAKDPKGNLAQEHKADDQ